MIPHKRFLFLLIFERLFLWVFELGVSVRELKLRLKNWGGCRVLGAQGRVKLTFKIREGRWNSASLKLQ